MSKKIFDTAEFTADDVKQVSKKLIADINKSIRKNYNKKSPYVLISTSNNKITSALNKQINITSSGYDDVVKEMNKLIRDRYKLSFTKQELKRITSKKSITLDSMIIRSDMLKLNLKEMLLQNLGNKLTFTQMVEGLKALQPNYTQYTYTLANTGIQRMYKTSTWDKISKEFDYFIYSGPKDSKNRQYCKDHVRKVYTKAQAKPIQATIDTFYNCRHEMRPISKKEYTKRKSLQK